MGGSVSLLRLWVRLAFKAAPVLGVLQVLTAGLAAVLLPFATLGAGVAVDGLFTEQPDQARRGVLLISAWLVAELLATVGRTVVARTMYDLNERYVNTCVLEVLSRIPTIEYRYDPQMADDVSAVRENARELAGGAQQLTAVLSTVVGTVSVGAVLASVSPWLLVIIPAAAVPVWAAGRLTNSRLEAEHANRWAVRRADRILELVRDADQAVEIRCGGAGPALLDATREGLSKRRAVVAEVAHRGRTTAVLSRLLFLLLCAVLVFILLAQVRAGGITTGDLIVVVLLLPAIEALVGGFQDGAHQVVDAWRGLLIYRRIEQYAQQRDDPDAASSPARLEHGIVLDGVSFTYPRAEHAALHDVDLHLRAGEVVALVGENGAGKSTLVALLARLLDPAAGTITIDGEEIRDLDVDSWRRRATAAFQDHVNLQLSAQLSVGVGDLESCEDPLAVYRALDRGAARDTVDALPAGLATQLGRDFRDGVDLSGGQWQRLAIARGMMRPAPLLTLLDEPTSALDPDAEALILGSYVLAARAASAEAGGISLIVTHRMSTARLADRILFLENGRIVEDGNHDTLVERGGRYAELFEVQARGYR